MTIAHLGSSKTWLFDSSETTVRTTPSVRFDGPPRQTSRSPHSKVKSGHAARSILWHNKRTQDLARVMTRAE